MLTFEHIQQMMNEIDEDVVTLYLHVDPSHLPNQNQPPAWNIFIKNALREIEKQLDGDGQDSWKITRTILEDYLNGYSPQGKTLVLFGGENTLHSHEIPIPIDNQWGYGAPLIVPLLWAIDEYEPYLVVLVDNEEARFLTTYLGSADTREEMTIDFEEYDFHNRSYLNNSRGSTPTGQPMAQGAGRDNFEDMKNAHIYRFHKDVAEAIRERADAIGAQRIVLGGNDKAAHQVNELLHEQLKNKVIGVLPIPLITDEHRMSESILQAATNREREEEMELVETVIGLAKSGGRGALGIEAVQNALKMQQVELLILPYPMEDEALAAELTLQAVGLGTEIELVHGSSAARLMQEGSVAARLYYAINTPEEA